jgi:hypothetical protein
MSLDVASRPPGRSVPARARRFAARALAGVKSAPLEIERSTGKAVSAGSSSRQGGDTPACVWSWLCNRALAPGGLVVYARAACLAQPSSDYASFMATTPFDRAVDKFQQNLVPYGVAVAYERALTEPDQDGDSWSLLAFDGDDTETLIASLSKSESVNLTRPVAPEDIEHAVEHRAGAYPLETRLADLSTQDELVLTADELNQFT